MQGCKPVTSGLRHHCDESIHPGYPNPRILERAGAHDWLVVLFRIERDFADQLSFRSDDVDVIIEDVEKFRLSHVFPPDVEVTLLA